jgi:hypothetical protein
MSRQLLLLDYNVKYLNKFDDLSILAHSEERGEVGHG